MQGLPDLAYRYFGGEGQPPMVILHGLLGSSRNWTSLARTLAETYEVFAVDLRNHGDSPHAESMSWGDLAADLEMWRLARGLDRFTLLGHSLGGKVGMAYAFAFPGHLTRLIIADIAPVTYAPRWEKEFAALNALHLNAFPTRKAVDEALADDVPDWAFRQFLLTNLTRDPVGGLRWSINLPALTAALPQLFSNPLEEYDRFLGNALFLRGEKSHFVTEEHLPAIRLHFPGARIFTLEQAGHNLHIDNPNALLAAIEENLAIS